MKNKELYLDLIKWAKAEDLGTGDVTCEVTIPASQQGKAALVFREAGVLCGMYVAAEVLSSSQYCRL